MQRWVEACGRLYRVDLLWPDARLIVEADGLLKYRDDPRALANEKRRQEFLERAGYRVIRVLWEDVMFRPAETAERVRVALLTAR